MRIRVIYLGVIRHKAGKNEDEYELAEGSPLKNLLIRVVERYPSLKDIIGGSSESPADPTLITALNGVSIKVSESDNIILKDRDTVTLMTVIGGG
ncbi:MAG: MoaD/ThiS family protein [Candidatus Bathyarchaeia archaeon]